MTQNSDNCKTTRSQAVARIADRTA